MCVQGEQISQAVKTKQESMFEHFGILLVPPPRGQPHHEPGSIVDGQKVAVRGPEGLAGSAPRVEQIARRMEMS